jgi:predicted HTH transcriptional regulator
MNTKRMLQIDEIDSEIIDYIATHGKANAGELAALVGITVPSIRYRIFQLMAKRIVGQQKSRNHQVWWFLLENEKARAAHQEG